MSARRIRVSTRSTGTRETVDVYVYESLQDMRRAAHRFNSSFYPSEDALAVTQSASVQRISENGDIEDVSHTVVVRLVRGHLGSRIIVHEMVHAAMALYGRYISPDRLAADEFHAANEPMAYLAGELTGALVDRLYALNYYT